MQTVTLNKWKEPTMGTSSASLVAWSVLALCAAEAALAQSGPLSEPADRSMSQLGLILRPVVEVEQELYSYRPAKNGAGPMWCFGNTCIVRLGDEVLVSGIRTLSDHVPLNNVRWMLLRCDAAGKAAEVANGGDSHEREPCPITCFDDGRVFLSTNPNSCKPDQRDGPAQPQVLEFAAANPSARPSSLLPKWNRDLVFHGHTYRSFAADGPRHEMILFYNTAYDKTYWSFRDSQGRWSAQGEIDFPWGKEYDKPQPVRVCYPTVQLRDRAVYYCGVSDIVEPYQAWRAYKKQLTGQDWDYDFRRLLFTWSDDITTGKFHPWVEIASRDKTCGWLFPCDLWVAPDKAVHLLWAERAIDTRLREKFFPTARQSIALNYAVVREGKVVLRKPVLQLDEGQHSDLPGRGRFHVTPDGRLFVLYFASAAVSPTSGARVPQNRLVEVLRDGAFGEPIGVPLKRPLETFFVAGVRGGSAPSDLIDLLGESEATLRYCRIRLR